jgi:hypothetical protein
MAEETAMSDVATGSVDVVVVSKSKPPAPGQETEDVFSRAKKGDESCLPQVRALLNDGEYGRSLRESAGSSAEWLRRSLIQKAAAKNVLIREAINQKLDGLQAELEGPNPTPIERLLAERASLCWFILHRYEDSYVNSTGWSIHQANLQQRKIDKAHAPFVSALLTLARVRKLAVPTLQVNVARNQVNVAETRP